MKKLFCSVQNICSIHKAINLEYQEALGNNNQLFQIITLKQDKLRGKAR
jgi:hypothetical protein